jgi:putative SbcD/Mre11-related phosphoesterase
MLDFLQKHCKQVVLVQGNHDNILGPIAAFKKIKIEKHGFFFEKTKIFVAHGDKIPETKEFKKSKITIIGHEHPAISLRDKTKQETFKCFLKGKFRKKDLIVLPSMSSIAYGTDVKRQEILSPFLQKDLSEFETWVIEDKVYYFGKIKDIK